MVINEIKYFILLHLIVVNSFGTKKTLFSIAVEKGNQSIVEILAKSGADIHQTVNKETPYMIAKKYQHKEIIEYFDKLKKWIPGNIIEYFTTK